MGLDLPSSAGLEQELGFLRQFKRASELHDSLMMTFLSMVTRSSGNILLRSMLRQTLESFARLTGAEESSFFWLDGQGYVTESILARGVAVREQRETVVGQVLEKGLAGWVYRQREIGIITDTEHDERWLQLPYQPYVAKSIVCFPILRGTHLLAIATLMHSEVGYFDQEKVQLVELCAARVGMVLDLLRLRLEELEKKTEETDEPEREEKSPPPKNQAFPITEMGQLVLSSQGKVLFGNPQFGVIFGYAEAELPGLNFATDLIDHAHRDAFWQRFAQCFTMKRGELLLNFRGVHRQGKSLKLEFHGHLGYLGETPVVVAGVREVKT